MINIIKKGNPKINPKYFYKTTCPLCECIFEFELEDVNPLSREFGNPNGDIVCPYCEYKYTIYLNDCKCRKEYPKEK